MPAPANDDFANRITLTGSSGSWSGTNLDATTEIGEPLSWPYNSGDIGIWFEWTCPSSGRYQWDTFSVTDTIDTILNIFEGVTLGTMTLFAGNDDAIFAGPTGVYPYQSCIRTDFIGGNTYMIRLDGYSTGGPVTLNWGVAVALSAPPAPSAGEMQLLDGYAWSGGYEGRWIVNVPPLATAPGDGNVNEYDFSVARPGGGRAQFYLVSEYVATNPFIGGLIVDSADPQWFFDDLGTFSSGTPTNADTYDGAWDGPFDLGYAITIDNAHTDPDWWRDNVPTVFTVTPNYGQSGDTIVLTGHALGNTYEVGHVGFYGGAALTVDSDSQVTITVDPSWSPGGDPIRLGVYWPNFPFTVFADSPPFYVLAWPYTPLIFGFAPDPVSPGDIITTTGTRFVGVTSMYMSDYPGAVTTTPIVSFTVIDDSTIEFTMPTVSPGRYLVSAESVIGAGTALIDIVRPAPTITNATGWSVETLHDFSPASIYARGIAVSSDESHIVVGTNNHDIYQIDLTNWADAVTPFRTLTGGSILGFCGDDNDNLYVTGPTAQGITRIALGVVTDDWVVLPGASTVGVGLGWGADGIVYAVGHDGTDKRIFQITPSGFVGQVFQLHETDPSIDYDYVTSLSDGTVWVSLDPPPAAYSGVDTVLRRFDAFHGTVEDFPIQTMVNPGDGTTEAFGGLFVDEHDHLIVPMTTYSGNGTTTATLGWFLRVSPDGLSVERRAGTWSYTGAPTPSDTATNIADGPITTALMSDIDEGAGMSVDRKTLYFVGAGDSNAGVVGNLLRTLAAPPPPPPPTVTSFTPSSGQPGDLIVITGTNLATTTSVFASDAWLNADSDTQVTAQVPLGCSGGPIEVITLGGTVESTDSFTVVHPSHPQPINDVFGDGSARAGGTPTAAVGTCYVVLAYVNNPDGFTPEAVGGTLDPHWHVIASGTIDGYFWAAWTKLVSPDDIGYGVHIVPVTHVTGVTYCAAFITVWENVFNVGTGVVGTGAGSILTAPPAHVGEIAGVADGVPTIVVRAPLIDYGGSGGTVLTAGDWRAIGVDVDANVYAALFVLKNALTPDDSTFETSVGAWYSGLDDYEVDRVTSPVPHRGTGVLRITFLGGSPNPADTPNLGSAAGGAHATRVSPGQVVKLTAWFRADPANAHVGEYYVVVTLRATRANGSTAGAADALLVLSESDWGEITVIGTMPSGAKWLSIETQLLGPGIGTLAAGDRFYLSDVALDVPPALRVGYDEQAAALAATAQVSGVRVRKDRS